MIEYLNDMFAVLMAEQHQMAPLEINEWTDLADFDEYEAKAAGWPPELITAAIREIQRRELDT